MRRTYRDFSGKFWKPCTLLAQIKNLALKNSLNHNFIDQFLFFSAPGGDFQNVLDEDMVPFEEDVQGFLRQILEALDFIHERNIAHLDIKVITLMTCH